LNSKEREKRGEQPTRLVSDKKSIKDCEKKGGEAYLEGMRRNKKGRAGKDRGT